MRPWHERDEASTRRRSHQARGHPRNNLASQTTGGSERFAFLYNADGIRVRTAGSDPAGSLVDHFLLPDGRPAFERVTVGGVTSERSFVYLGDRLLARFDGSGTVEHLVSDHIAYPLATFADGGDLLWEAEALPFGEINTVLHGDAAGDPLLRYPGQWALDAIGGGGNTGLFYNQHRWYRAGWGRYTQVDPLTDLLAYRYADDNPESLIDPLGLLCGPWQEFRPLEKVVFEPYQGDWYDVSSFVPSRGWAGRSLGIVSRFSFWRWLLTRGLRYCCRETGAEKYHEIYDRMIQYCDCGAYNPRFVPPPPPGYVIYDSEKQKDLRGCCYLAVFARTKDYVSRQFVEERPLALPECRLFPLRCPS